MITLMKSDKFLNLTQEPNQELSSKTHWLFGYKIMDKT